MPEGQQRTKRATARGSRAHPAPPNRNDPKPSAAKSAEAVPESAAAEGAECPSPDRAELEQVRARLVAARSDIQYRGRR